MKRNKTKPDARLTLKNETLRTLGDAELGEVGGGDGTTVTIVGTIVITSAVTKTLTPTVPTLKPEAEPEPESEPKTETP